MSGVPFVLAMAWREGRASAGRLGFLLAAVTAGVAALVAINSFTANVQESVRAQARLVLGADLAMGSAQPFSAAAEERLRRLLVEGRAGARPPALARVVRFGAMARAAGNGGTRLVQATAVEPGYPFYGEVRTDPAFLWPRLQDEQAVLLDPSLLSALGVGVGDRIALGEGDFVVRGTVLDVPGDVALRTALGPRLFLSTRFLPATGLLTFGSRARHEAYVRLPEPADAEKLALRHRPALAAERVSLRTVEQEQEALGRSLGRLGRYLGLVALVALLLGGLGVASAVHVLVRKKLDTVAVLRCLGASAGRLLAVYLTQAAFMGLLGGLVGAAAGVLVQVALPAVLGEFLPVDVPFAISWTSVAAGVGVGLWAALGFALLPLLAVRRVSPLLLLRRDYEPPRGGARDRARWAAAAALSASVVAVAAWQAPSLASGLVFAAAIGVALTVFWLAAVGLIRLMKRVVPARWPYVWRQGLANLHRPANQTVAVVLALGFGAFLLDTLFLVQHNLLRDLRVDGGPGRPNLLLFDIQPDQRAGVADALRPEASEVRTPVPIVPMRIQAIKGQPVTQMLAVRSVPRERRPGDGPPGWALRREYRSTYRDTLLAAEKTSAGGSWPPAGWRPGETPVPLSLEDGLAQELGVSVGDEVVWDVQGRAVPTRVAHLREVDWARFEPNFFAVFPVGPLADAPQTFVTLARVDEPSRRAQAQRRVVDAFPNVSVLDLSQVQQAIERVVARTALAIRFMALFSLAAGAVVLAGAVAASRWQRLREAVLLKTLGATRRQLLRIALAEYLCLGLMAAAAAALLATGAGWALMRLFFESPFTVPGFGLAALGAAVVALTLAVGLLGSREVFRRTPLELLRNE